jgi:hypothetical protein
VSDERYKSADWLRSKYVGDGLDANAIGRLVGRDGKTIWTWLRKFGVPTRPRGRNATTHFKKGQPAHNKGRPMSACQRELIRQAALADGRVPFDRKIGPPLKGKRGAQVPTWKGGVTPERQVFYSTPEWKAAARLVWTRDNATCRRCGRRNKGRERFAFDIHHVVSFEFVPLRSEASNLILLCERCHYWAHSNANVNKQFIGEVPSAT